MTEDGRRSRITTAVLILAFGVVFLLRALGVLGERWWAMLVAASALPFLLGAWLRYRASGKFARSAVATSTIGLAGVLLDSGGQLPPERAAYEVSRDVGSYRAADQMRGLASELDRLRAQVLLSWPREARLLGWLGLRDGMRVLELGCGPGFVTEQLLALVPHAHVTALDRDAELLGRARQALAGDARVGFVQASAGATGLADACFDFVLARYLFQHLPDPEAVAREALRVLRPGGRLAVVDLDAALWGIVDPAFPEVQPIYAKTGRAQAARGGD